MAFESFGTPKSMEEDTGRSPWKKFVRGFWITVGIFFAVIIFGFIAILGSGPTDDEDLTDNQEYIITVKHQSSVYEYYCSGYKKNLVNNSYILVDYEGNPFCEIFYTPEFYMTVKLNPDYKKEYFLKEGVETEKETDKQALL